MQARNDVMMHDFLTGNRETLAARCRVNVEQRQGRPITTEQLQNGIPMLLDQLIRTLRAERSHRPGKSLEISGPADGRVTASEIGVSAAQHGKDLFALGFSVNQVVHHYGDLCQAITDLAIERSSLFCVDEFRTLNRCLDNAIADAVTEFSYQRELILSDAQVSHSNERIGYFAHELRNLLGTVWLAFSAAKAGNLNLSGSTGAILERNIVNLGKLIDISLSEIKSIGQPTHAPRVFALAHLIAEITAAADLGAHAKGCTLTTTVADSSLAVDGDRDMLRSAIENLLQNAIKFTHRGSTVTLDVFAAADRIIIDVADQCGGLPAGTTERLFTPFLQSGHDRSGLGLGLTIAQQGVAANQGTLLVRNRPGVGCVFSIDLPRYEMPIGT
jgi:signal transduction histidine kinase